MSPGVAARYRSCCLSGAASSLFHSVSERISACLAQPFSDSASLSLSLPPPPSPPPSLPPSQSVHLLTVALQWCDVLYGSCLCVACCFVVWEHKTFTLTWAVYRCWKNKCHIAIFSEVRSLFTEICSLLSGIRDATDHYSCYRFMHRLSGFSFHARVWKPKIIHAYPLPPSLHFVSPCNNIGKTKVTRHIYSNNIIWSIDWMLFFIFLNSYCSAKTMLLN